MKFKDMPNAADDAEVRKDRGVHEIVLEEGDAAPALRVVAPFLAVKLDANDYVISFANAADISLRFMRLTDPAACLLKFYERQCSADPLSRSWQLVLPGLGLATMDIATARGMERRELRSKIDAAVQELTAEDKDKLSLAADDFMHRLARVGHAGA